MVFRLYYNLLSCQAFRFYEYGNEVTIIKTAKLLTPFIKSFAIIKKNRIILFYYQKKCAFLSNPKYRQPLWKQHSINNMHHSVGSHHIGNGNI